MHFYYRFYVALFCALLLTDRSEAQIASVADAGIHPDTYENVTARIQKVIDDAIRTGKTTLMFPKGRYDLWPDGAIREKYFISNTATEKEDSLKIRTIGMLFREARNLTIDGNGALFVFHGKMTTIVLDHCENVKLQNIRVDFERPTMSEMRYAKVENGEVELDIQRDARYAIRDGKLEWFGEGWKTTYYHAVEFDTTLKTMRYSDWKPYANAQATEMGLGRVRFRTSVTPRPGNMLTVRDIIRDQVGMHIRECKNVTLEDVGMHYMHGLGIVSQFTENITMRRVTCAPRPETGRIIASSADFMHFSGCRGKVTVEDCRFSGAHDDPINVHGTNLRIVGRPDANTLKVRFMHGQSYGFNAFFPGDTVAFVHSASMERFAGSLVKTAERLNDREVLLTFEKPVPTDLQEHDCVENMTWTPEVLIRRNHFTRTNTRGILLTTPRKAVIENNTFFRTGMSAVLIEADAEGWYESGPVRDVTIRNNEFIDCAYQGGPGNAVIAINPSNKVVDIKKPVHFNIRIEGNIFKTFDYPVLYAKSTQGLIFGNNQIIRTHDLSPESGNHYMLWFNGCSDVEVSGLKLEGNVLGKNIRLENMPEKSLKMSNSPKLALE